MALADGGYAWGTAGTDRIQGDFYGPDRGETYGIFDTDTVAPVAESPHRI